MIPSTLVIIRAAMAVVEMLPNVIGTRDKEDPAEGVLHRKELGITTRLFTTRKITIIKYAV
jgi:hypothetical protein